MTYARILGTSLALLLAATHAEARPARRQMLSRIVAIVGDELVTTFELEARIRPLLAQAAATPAPRRADAEARLRKELLQKIVEEKIVARAARAAGLTVEDAEVEATFDSMARQRGLSRAELVVEAGRRGVTEPELREESRRLALLAKVLRTLIFPRISGKASLSSDAYQRRAEAELEAWLEEQRRLIYVEVRP